MIIDLTSDGEEESTEVSCSSPECSHGHNVYFIDSDDDDLDGPSNLKDGILDARGKGKRRHELQSTLAKRKRADEISSDNSSAPVSDNDHSAILSSPALFTHHFLLRAVQGNAVITTQDEYTVTYTSTPQSLSAWKSHLPASCTLGFDTEGEGRVLQLACLQTRRILIFLLPSLPSECTNSVADHSCLEVLEDILGSSEYDKVGVAAVNDAIVLAQKYGMRMSNIFDLTYLSRDLEIDTQGNFRRSFKADRARGVVVVNEDKYARPTHAGLKTLFSDLFEARFSSMGDISGPDARYEPPECPAKGASKWTTYPLRYTELEYAAKDALFGSLLYNAMITKYTEHELAALKAQAAAEFSLRLDRRFKRTMEHKTRQEQRRDEKRKGGKQKHSSRGHSHDSHSTHSTSHVSNVRHKTAHGSSGAVRGTVVGRLMQNVPSQPTTHGKQKKHKKQKTKHDSDRPAQQQTSSNKQAVKHSVKTRANTAPKHVSKR